MAVQAAVSSSVQDFFQVQSSARTDACSQEAVSPDVGAGQEFKKLLLSMRQAHRGASGENSADKKNPAPVIVKNAVASGDTAVLLEAEITEKSESEPVKNNTAAVPEERAASRFDPDVILGAPSEAEIVKYENSEEISGDENIEDPEKSGEENPPVMPAEEPVEIPLMNAYAAETAFEAASAAEAPAEEPEAVAAEPLPFRNEYESEERPVAADIPKKIDGAASEPEGKRAAEDAARANAGAARRADVSGPPEENTEKTAPAPSDRPGKVRRDAEDNAAGPGEKVVSRREPSQAKDSPEKSEKSPPDPAAFGSARTGQVFHEGIEIRSSAPAQAVYSLRSGNKFGEGLASVVELMNRDGLPEARIVVEPPALGRIDVALRTTSNGVEALFRVENEELRQMVQFQLDSLKTSLQAQGIHVSALAVDIRNNEGQKGRYSGAPKKGRRVNLGDVGDDIAETKIARLDLENGLLHWVA